MKNMTLANIAKACGGTLCCAKGKEQEEIKGAVLDSRKVEEGFLFFATEGEKVDGHGFIPQVFRKGALCVVCEKEPADWPKIEESYIEEMYVEDAGDEREQCPYILVKDSLQALKDTAEFYREQLSIPVVGITGSVGKTSTKEFIAGVLERKYKVLKTQGNYNNEIGVPLTILEIRPEHEVAVVEMGISDFGEMHRLSKIVKPDICVITNIGQCHLDKLGTREGILKAKSEIFDYMNPKGYICLNGDDDMLATIDKVENCTIYRFGLDANHAVHASGMVNRGLFGSETTMYIAGDTYPVTIQVPGKHMVYNALAAACVARILEVDPWEIQAGVMSIKPISGRSHIIAKPKRIIIDDCYNANPISMKAAIDLLTNGITRKVAILGDMYELGANSDAMHEAMGTYAVHQKIDLVLCVGEHAKHMYEGVTKAGGKANYYETREELLKELKSSKTPLKLRDTILVKASHGMEFDKVVEVLQELP